MEGITIMEEQDIIPLISRESGLGHITDILTSIRYNIYDKKKYTWKELMKPLMQILTGYEQLRYDLIYNTPKYGNDDDYADQQAVTVFEIYYDAVNGRPSTRGGVHRINMLPTTSHVYFGSVTGATADGRKAFTPFLKGYHQARVQITRDLHRSLNQLQKLITCVQEVHC